MIGLLMLAATYAAASGASIEDRTLEYHCADRAVVGRVQSQAYERIADDNDFIGHGRVGANITVRRIVRGPKLPSVMPASYVAHTYMRDDRDFMLILRQQADGSFEIVSGQLMSVHPRLARTCK